MTKVGVVGVGSMGRNHARVLAELGALGGVADPDAKARAEVAARFGVKGYADHREMLEHVDAVVVATPTKYHMATVIDAAEKGKHVLCEKPIAATVRDGREMLAVARKAGIVLAVGMIERHNPVVGFAKVALAEKRFGELVSLSARRVSAMPGRIKDVGCVLDLGIHDIDVMRYLAGSPAKSVYALTGMQGEAAFEDHADVLIEFGNGVSGVSQTNWLTPMKVRRLSMTCMKNFVELDYMTQGVTISSSQYVSLDQGDLFHAPLEFDIRNISLKKQEPLKNELSDFISAIKNGGTPLVSGEEGLESMRVALAAIASSAGKRKVDMEDFGG
jgi:UDP-N-acetylglucosamine 3-dehydrogenase